MPERICGPGLCRCDESCVELVALYCPYCLAIVEHDPDDEPYPECCGREMIRFPEKGKV